MRHVLLFFLPLTLGCDFLSSATARTVVAGIVARSPDLMLAGQYQVDGEVFAEAWVGTRKSETDTSEPTPIRGADVTVEFSGKTVVLTESSEAGRYSADSTNSDLVYDSTLYVVTAQTNDDSADFGGSVMAPTQLSAAAMQLSPQPTEAVPGFPDVQRHPKSTALSISWGEQFGKYGYVTVFRSKPSDPENPELVFDNRPSSAKDYLDLVVGNPPDKIEIPADTFSQDGVYAVVLVAMERGDVLPSTFIGSPQLAGTGAARFLAVGNVSL